MRALLYTLNVDRGVTGIVLQRPVSPSLSMKAFQSAIHPLKDVEGMHPASIGNIVYNVLELKTCTVMASVELLRRTGQPLKGLEITVIGHLEIVGKTPVSGGIGPVAIAMLMRNTVSAVRRLKRHYDAQFGDPGPPAPARP